MKTKLRAGIDVGSTTIKAAFLGAGDELVYGEYRRHRSDIRGALSALLAEACAAVGAKAGEEVEVEARLTGSGGMAASRWLGIPFTQEVVASARAVRRWLPAADVAIELGGEDAKITYFRGGLDQRMNGSCAGGTGSFIDQMAILLETDAAGLDALARGATTIYPIAARCGVFAKTDIQPLINEGARKADVAASVFQAVVNQTISGLACGKPIRGRVALLGGPLHFLPALRERFKLTLQLGDDGVLAPPDAQLFVAMGAALSAERRAASADGGGSRAGTRAAACGQEADYMPLSELARRAREMAAGGEHEVERLRPLFADGAELEEFRRRHEGPKARRTDFESLEGPCWLGIDAGSTTTKACLVDSTGAIAWSFYASNGGSPLDLAMRTLRELLSSLPAGAWIGGSCATGYGEPLLRGALETDWGEVETIAHYRAARELAGEVDSILDIGGQDMKFVRLADGAIVSILLNEACSSGCGSFLEGFAKSLGSDAEAFARAALDSRAPVDLGSRCTVFMNSRVKQAQKEGATVADISAGLSYSIIKNALQKVIRLRDPAQLGERVVVQGGTFRNDAVLRAFELVSGREGIRPDIAGLMGAYGAALLARDKACQRARETGEAESRSSLISLERLEALTSAVELSRCQICPNNCLLTLTRFSDGRAFVSGNRCERGARAAHARSEETTGEGEAAALPDLFAWKYERTFRYKSLPRDAAPRGVVGIPRVLNMYEYYPFWHRFLTELGFSVVLSPRSSRKVYERGIESIPSESVCYPGKLVHGHVESLVDAGVKLIFYPCLPYGPKEDAGANNQFSCPIVASYPEVIKNNVESLSAAGVRYMDPFLPMESKARLKARLAEEFAPFGATGREAARAVDAAWREQERFRAELRAKGEEALAEVERRGLRAIVLAGRPYHLDPEIHHGLPGIATALGFAVLTEDSVAHLARVERPLRVVDQWVFHTRLYAAAHFVAGRKDVELVQLNSFGCGLDAVTADQVDEILRERGKIHSLIKIDEQSNLGAVRIRLRSLKAALDEREASGTAVKPKPRLWRKVLFTEAMRKAYTILAPQLSPIHFRVLETAFRESGYRLEVLPDVDRSAVDVGLTHVNNDACYPSIIVVGQMMKALQSGDYDLDRTALLITQTGGGCRATNYIGFIRKALAEAGFAHVPVISLSAQGLEKNPGFKLGWPVVKRGFMALVYGDLLMRLLHRTRPYERDAGAAQALLDAWVERCKASLRTPRFRRFGAAVDAIVRDFDALPLLDVEKPKVGVVGEILVKFHPTANNSIVDVIEAEGAEAVLPDLTDFLLYSLYGPQYKRRFLSGKATGALVSRLGIAAIELFRKRMKKALAASNRFAPPLSIYELAAGVDGIVQLGNTTGEGWFLTAEMVELVHSGVSAIACIQPFACLPNHVTGKGMIKELRRRYPGCRIAAIDYDPGASEVNQLNRIKLLLSGADAAMEGDAAP